jgi:hypothetical protein
MLRALLQIPPIQLLGVLPLIPRLGGVGSPGTSQPPTMCGLQGRALLLQGEHGGGGDGVGFGVGSRVGIRVPFAGPARDQDPEGNQSEGMQSRSPGLGLTVAGLSAE